MFIHSAFTMLSQFSKDCKYFAHIAVDGKLKIWNTISNSFDQEFTPDFHLASPFTCLNFIELDYTKDKVACALSIFADVRRNLFYS